jgi:hypothetical protein
LLDLNPITDTDLIKQYGQSGLALAKMLAPGKGNLQWGYGGQSTTGYFYPGPTSQTGQMSSRYTVGADPQCSDTGKVVAGIAGSCTLQALYMTKYNADGTPVAFSAANYAGRAVLVNPMPGHQGTFNRFVEGIGSFSLDMGLIKNLMIVEGKSVQIRVQATNILNHPAPCGTAFGGGQNACPALGLATNTNYLGGNNATQGFGQVNKQYYQGNMWGWGMNRQFQANMRLLF